MSSMLQEGRDTLLGQQDLVGHISGSNEDVHAADLNLVLIAAGSSAGVCMLAYFASRVLSPYIFKTYYTKLPRIKKRNWNNLACSNLHALSVFMASCYLWLYSGFFRDGGPVPIVNRSSPITEAVLAISLGYFFLDIAFILNSYPALGGFEFVCHHLGGVLALVMGLYYGQGHVYQTLLLATEITTPFVNLRWYLSTAGLKDSSLYTINGVLMFLGWLVFRVLLFAFFFYHVATHWDEIWREVAPFGGFLLVFLGPLFAGLNLYWFYKICKGLVKLLSSGPKVADKDE